MGRHPLVFCESYESSGQIISKNAKNFNFTALSYIICKFAKGVCPLVRVKMFNSSGSGSTRFNESLCFEWVRVHSFFVKAMNRVDR